MGDIIVLIVLACIIGAVIRSIWVSHKNGKACGCSGNCGNCCSGGCQGKQKTRE